MKSLLTSLRMIIALTVVTGIAYPLAVWAVGQSLFRHTAEGSLETRGGKVVGSSLLAQKTTGPTYFWPRPSGGDYATVASGATNYAWTNAKLQKGISDADGAFRTANALSPSTVVPAEMVTASGSGLDPDISPEAARLQIARVSKARGLGKAGETALDQLVTAITSRGILSAPTVNVLRLNLALDDRFPKP